MTLEEIKGLSIIEPPLPLIFHFPRKYIKSM